MKKLEHVNALDSSKLRFLDIDDLIILSKLFDGLTLVSTARNLGLSQPAVSNRLRKIEQVFDSDIVRKNGRTVSLSEKGHQVCSIASDALRVLSNMNC